MTASKAMMESFMEVLKDLDKVHLPLMKAHAKNCNPAILKPTYEAARAIDTIWYTTYDMDEKQRSQWEPVAEKKEKEFEKLIDVFVEGCVCEEK